MATHLDNTDCTHVLLTVLGTNANCALYTLEGRQFQATLAPVALLELLPQASRPERIFAICTPEAAEATWPTLVEELGNRSRECELKRIDVPSGSESAHIDDFLQEVAGAIPANAELTVDVTHGFRHYSFLTYVAVQYLSALHGARVRGAYYGVLGQGLDDTSPFLDLRPILELPRWTHALEVLRDTGSTLPMAEEIRREPYIGGENGAQQLRRNIATELSHISESYLSGLPLELGRQSRLFRCQRLKPLKRLLARNHRLPLAGDLIERLDKILANFVLAELSPNRGWKKHVALSEAEMKRQAKTIDSLLKHGHTATALGLMNEWTVSWAVLRRDPEGHDWLDYQKVRRKATRALDAIRIIGEDNELNQDLTVEQRAFGVFWRDLTDLRNGFHHHGMRPRVLVGDNPTRSRLCDVQRYWYETLRSCPDIKLTLGGAKGWRVLVSPIGMRPGVLFSALHVCRNADVEPDICLVLCSDDTRKLIDDAISHANFKGVVKCLSFKDPFGGGRPEIERLTKMARKQFIGAESVLVNVTGGTTLMGLAAEDLANAARHLSCPVRRFGLIDRRPSARQDKDTFRVGESFWLDEEDDSRANRL